MPKVKQQPAVEDVANEYLESLPDFVSTQFTTWLPIVVQTFTVQSESSREARDCCDAISYHSGCFETRREPTTGNFYLKQDKRFKRLKCYKGISLGMARDLVLRLLFTNGVPRFYVFAKDMDSDQWHLQSTVLRHEDAYKMALALGGQSVVPIRVLPCSWQIPSIITDEQMKEQEHKCRLIAWNIEQCQSDPMAKASRGHEARMAMRGLN